MSLRYAVEDSKNGCAYSLYNIITPKVGLSYIENMNFSKIVRQDYTLSSGLGGLHHGTNTVEMANAYSTLETMVSIGRQTVFPLFWMQAAMRSMRNRRVKRYTPVLHRSDDRYSGRRVKFQCRYGKGLKWSSASDVAAVQKQVPQMIIMWHGSVDIHRIIRFLYGLVTIIRNL